MEKEFLRLKEVAKMTGFSQSTLRRWIAMGQCPAFRKTPTGILLFRPCDIKTWLDSLTQPNSVDGGTDDAND